MGGPAEPWRIPQARLHLAMGERGRSPGAVTPLGYKMEARTLAAVFAAGHSTLDLVTFFFKFREYIVLSTPGLSLGLTERCAVLTAVHGSSL